MIIITAQDTTQLFNFITSSCILIISGHPILSNPETNETPVTHEEVDNQQFYRTIGNRNLCIINQVTHL